MYDSVTVSELSAALRWTDSETPHIDAVVVAAQHSEMQARFSELDKKLRDASDAVEQVAEVYATAVRDGVFDK
eukprot:COSAG02_NODE_21590_length_782_cov_0.947291_1_plen_72_part_01